MMTITIVGCVAMMVAIALCKGHTSKKAMELRQGLASLESEEKRAHRERETAGILKESSEARAGQVQYQCQRAQTEIEELESLIQQIKERLGQPSEDEDDGPE